MSRLDELIAELCPDGVKYEPLWKVTIWDKKFNGVDRCKQPYTICYPYLLANELFDLEQESGDVFLLSTGERIGFTTEELAGKYICEGEIVAIPWGKSRPVAEVIKYYNGKFVTADNRIVTSIDKMILLNKFLFYWMTSEGKKFDIFYRGSGIKHPSMKDILEMRIPIPPLPVQEEIVRILDKFTELTNELTAELTKRKQQYKYYCDKLIHYHMDGNKFPVTKVGDIARFTYGYTEKAQDVGAARFIRITDITEDGCLNSINAKYVNLTKDNKRYLLKKGDILMARTGATYGKTVCIPNDAPAIYASFLIKISLDNTKIINRFYWHFSRSSMYWLQANNLASKGGQPQFNSNVLCKVLMPIPPLEEQKRIVAILDRFDALCNDLTSGLPAEIAARKKQYEYYRDKLLTFKEAV